MKTQEFQKRLQESSTKYIYDLFQKEILWVSNFWDENLTLSMNKCEKLTQKKIKAVANYIFKKYKKLKVIYIDCYFIQRNNTKITWIGM